MDISQKITLFALDLALPLTIGYGLAKTGRWRKESFDRLMLVGILVFAPLLTGLSFWNAHLDSTLIWLPILGALMQIVPGFIGIWRGQVRYLNPLERGSFIITCMFSNRSVIGILSVYILFGQAGYAYSRLALLLGAPTFYIIGFALANYYFQQSRDQGMARPDWRKVIWNRNQLPALGIILGLALNLLDVPRPSATIDLLFPRLVDIQAWLLLLPVGFGIDFPQLKRHFGAGLEVSWIKFLLTPLLICPLAWYLGCRGEIFGTLMVLSFSPASVGAVVAARLHHLDEHLPLASYLVTSLIYLLLIFPLLLLLMGMEIFKIQ